MTQVTLNVKNLAQKLAQNSKKPGSERAKSYQDFLNLICEQAGLSSYQALGEKKELVKALEQSRVVTAQYVMRYSGRTTISSVCKLDLSTMLVSEIADAEIDDSLGTLEEEYISYEGKKYAVIYDIFGAYPDLNPDKRFALSSIDDFKRATASVVDLIESAVSFNLDGHHLQFSLSGDWLDEVSSLFENGEISSDSLFSTTVWVPEYIDGGGSECYSAFELLFSQINKYGPSTCIWIPLEHGSVDIQVLS